MLARNQQLDFYASLCVCVWPTTLSDEVKSSIPSGRLEVMNDCLDCWAGQPVKNGSFNTTLEEPRRKCLLLVVVVVAFSFSLAGLQFGDDGESHLLGPVSSALLLCYRRKAGMRVDDGAINNS